MSTTMETVTLGGEEQDASLMTRPPDSLDEAHTLKEGDTTGGPESWALEMISSSLSTAFTEELIETQTASEKTLRRGSSGESVKKLQRLLNDDHAGLEVDGIFGAETAFAVQDFQLVHAPPSDGIVGPITWEALARVSARKKDTEEQTKPGFTGVDKDGEFILVEYTEDLSKERSGGLTAQLNAAIDDVRDSLDHYFAQRMLAVDELLKDLSLEAKSGSPLPETLFITGLKAALISGSVALMPILGGITNPIVIAVAQEALGKAVEMFVKPGPKQGQISKKQQLNRYTQLLKRRIEGGKYASKSTYNKRSADIVDKSPTPAALADLKKLKGEFDKRSTSILEKQYLAALSPWVNHLKAPNTGYWPFDWDIIEQWSGQIYAAITP